MRHMKTDSTGVDTSRGDELPEMVATEDGAVTEASEIDFSKKGVFGDRSWIEDFSPIRVSNEDRAALRRRVAELSAMSDTEILEAMRVGLQLLLEFEDTERNLFLRSLGNKLSAVHPDVRKIVCMWRHGGCDEFPDIRELLQSFDLPLHRERLRSADFFKDARRRRYVR